MPKATCRYPKYLRTLPNLKINIADMIKLCIFELHEQVGILFRSPIQLNLFRLCVVFRLAYVLYSGHFGFQRNYLYAVAHIIMI